MNSAVKELTNSYNLEIKPAIAAAKAYSGKSFIKDNLKFEFDPVSGIAKKEMNAVRKGYKGITSSVVDLDSSISKQLKSAGIPQGNSIHRLSFQDGFSYTSINPHQLALFLFTSKLDELFPPPFIN